VGKGAPSREKRKKIGLANLSEHLANMALPDGEKDNKLIDVTTPTDEELVLALLSDPHFTRADHVFQTLNNAITPKTLQAAIVRLRELAKQPDTAQSVVHAATDFAYLEENSIIINASQELLEARDCFVRQVAEVAILARDTLVQNKLLQGESGALDEVYVPCGRER
jgi:hypothetical protein